MANYNPLLLCFFCCITGFWANAQLYTDAGVNRTICRGDSVTLGGTDTAASAVAPFTYQWQPATGLSATNVAHPVAHPLVTTKYSLTSRDANGMVNVDYVLVTVKFNDVHLTTSDTLVCPNQQVQLAAFVPSSACGSTAPCYGNTITPSVGNDTVIQPGTPLQGPALFGNFRQSSRSQILYTSAELQAALGGPAVIKALTFNISQFNSNAFLQNFTIKMGCVYMDSLTAWNDNLLTVYSAAHYSPQMGWLNGIILQTPFYWDGFSDILVDICNYNPTTFGNQGNKAECTQTTYKSYLYSTGSINQCGGGSIPTSYYLRPNVKFNYCVPDSMPMPIFGSNYQWTCSSGLTLFNANSYTPTVQVGSAGYCYFTTNDSTCPGRDSVFINVRSNSDGNVTITLNNNFCKQTDSGSVIIAFSLLTDTALYTLRNVNSTTVIASGTAVNGDSITIAGLAAGSYLLNVSDPYCFYLDEIFTLSGFTAITSVSRFNQQSASCMGGASGGFCINVVDGIPPYTFMWDSIATTNNCFYGFTAGVHPVTIIDSFGCALVIDSFIVLEGTSPITAVTASNMQPVLCENASTGGFCVNVTGGTAPYTYKWDSVTTVNNCYYNFALGIHYVLVTDSEGCSSAVTPFTVPLDINAVPTLTVNDFVHCYGDATGSACITSLSGSTAYTYIWDSLYTGGICNDTLRAGTHFVLVRDTNGCENRSNTINVDGPEAPLTVVDTLTSATVYLQVSGGTVPYTINWGDGSSVTTFISYPHQYLQYGVYTVVVTDFLGCEHTSTITILGNSIATNEDRQKVTLYPNPANNVLFFTSEEGAITEALIYDALGRTITVTKQVSGNSIDVSGLTPGVYTLAIRTTTGLFKRMFVKQ